MSLMGKMFALMKCSIIGIKYLKNPWIVFKIPLRSQITLVPKVGDPLTIRWNQFLDYIGIFRNGWIHENGIVSNGKYKFKVLGANLLLEDTAREYHVENLKDKNVLDVGGLYGETAVMMIKEFDVDKVFVYEPVKENFELIKYNAEINSCGKSVFVENFGVSNSDGTITIKSANAPGTSGFGIPGDKFSVDIDVKSWNTILKKHENDNIYLAKIDCEGAEKHLIEADPVLIKGIPNWAIEIHSRDIEKNLLELFHNLGFRSILKETVISIKDAHVAIWQFAL